MSTTPPGWYDDAHGSVRWWDGAGWTEHVHAAEAGPAAAPAARPSRLWILWVVLGVVVLGLLVLATVVVPLLIGLVTRGAAPGGDADQRAAVEAVQSYDHAWGTSDCDEYFSVTSAGFREFQQIEDCDTFVAGADDFQASVRDYTLTVDDVETDDGSITVETTETYIDPLDEDADPEPVETRYSYVVVNVDGAWVIDDAD